MLTRDLFAVANISSTSSSARCIGFDPITQGLTTSVCLEQRFRQVLTSFDTFLSSAHRASTGYDNFGVLRRSLDQESAATLVRASVKSRRVDCCNTLLGVYTVRSSDRPVGPTGLTTSPSDDRIV